MFVQMSCDIQLRHLPALNTMKLFVMN